MVLAVRSDWRELEGYEVLESILNTVN